LINGESSNSERSSMRRMSMTNSFHIRSLAIDQKVHRQLARCFAVIQRLAIEIGDSDQIFCHSTLASHRWCGKDSTVI